jgi:hypothetical protein
MTNIANSIIGGIKFAAGGDDEHTRRVEQATRNEALQMEVGREKAKTITQRMYADGHDIQSDGRKIRVDAVSMVQNNPSLLRDLVNSNADDVLKFVDGKGRTVSTEVVGFDRGPNGGYIPLVKTSKGVRPMTENRSTRDDDPVLELSGDDLNSMVTEAFKSQLATAGTDFVLGGEMGKIDEALRPAFQRALQGGAMNNLAMDTARTQTGGDPAAMSHMQAIVGRTPDEAMPDLLTEMGADQKQIEGLRIQDTPVEAESLPPPTGQTGEVATPPTPSTKPEVVGDQANLQTMLDQQAQLKTDIRALVSKPNKTKKDRQDLTAMRRTQRDLRRDISRARTAVGKADSARKNERNAETMEMPLLGAVKAFANSIGITKEAVEGSEIEQMQSQNAFFGHFTKGGTPDQIPGFAPKQVGRAIDQGAQIPAEQQQQVVEKLRQDGVQNVEDMFTMSDMDTVMEAARVIAMTSDGSRKDKLDIYNSLVGRAVNTAQTGNPNLSAKDATEQKIEAFKATTARMKEVTSAKEKRTGGSTITSLNNTLDEVEATWLGSGDDGVSGAGSLFKKDGSYKKPDAKARTEIIRLSRRVEAVKRDPDLSDADKMEAFAGAATLQAQYLAAVVAGNNTSWFAPGSAFNDMFFSLKGRANPFENLYISEFTADGRPKRYSAVDSQGKPVDGSVPASTLTGSGISNADYDVLTQVALANTVRIGGVSPELQERAQNVIIGN